MACRATAFDVEFAPQTAVVVTSEGVRLGYASFAKRWVSPSCKRVTAGGLADDRGLGAEVGRHVVFHCAAGTPRRLCQALLRSAVGAWAAS